VEAPASGVLLKAKYSVDEVVPVTVIIGYIGEPGEEIEEEEPSPVTKPAPRMVPLPATAQRTAKAVSGRVKATPAARRLAREGGIDLSLVSGTGPDGLVRSEDVEAFVPP
jgi:pyruvate dehydrogenase E2 component (dihydrolipoamide acetyltransferase)